MRLLESFTARGHGNVTAMHKTTIELTKEGDLTLRGDCIIGVGATKAPAQFSEATRQALKQKRKFLFIFRVGGVEEHVEGMGDPALTLDDEHEMVIRKSTFISGRTVLVGCNKASIDLSPALRAALRNPHATISIELHALD